MNANQAKVLADYPEKISQIRESIEQMGFETSNIRDTLDSVNRYFRLQNYAVCIRNDHSFDCNLRDAEYYHYISCRTDKGNRVHETDRSRESDVKNLFVIESIILSFSGMLVGVMGAYISHL